MGRFTAQVADLEARLATWREEGQLQEVDLSTARGWPEGRRLVLGADAALDLGTPTTGSLAVLFWSTGESAAPGGDRVWRLGPDIPALAATCREAPLGLVIHVRGDRKRDADTEYERYLDLKDRLYAITPEGVTLRSMPSQQHLWLRLHREAVADGFTFAHLGAILVDAFATLPFVQGVEILLITAGREAIASLGPLAEEVHRRVGALVKRHEEEHAECDECEYQDVCDEKEHRP